MPRRRLTLKKDLAIDLATDELRGVIGGVETPLCATRLPTCGCPIYIRTLQHTCQPPQCTC